jgi:AraC-like DNA-binding protein
MSAAMRLGLVEMVILAANPAGIRQVPPALDRAMAALAAGPRVSITAAARAASMSPATLHALCAEHVRTTPAAWQLANRLDRARAMLAAGAAVTQVAADLGFSSPRYFAHAFRREVGISPSRFAALQQCARNEPARDW